MKTLLAHLVAVLRKLAVVGNGGDMTQVSDPADDRTDRGMPRRTGSCCGAPTDGRSPPAGMTTYGHGSAGTCRG